MTKVRVVTKRRGTQYRGLASLKLDDPALVQYITSLGGKAAHAQKVAHEWTSETGAIAGRLGGKASAKARAAKKAGAV